MKFRIHAATPTSEVASRLPPALRPHFHPSTLEEGELVDVVVFHASVAVVSARHAAKALTNATGDHRVLAVARRFTRDAAELLQAANATVVAEDTTFWSDTRYQEIRTLIGARVKRPESE